MIAYQTLSIAVDVVHVVVSVRVDVSNVVDMMRVNSLGKRFELNSKFQTKLL